MIEYTCRICNVTLDEDGWEDHEGSPYHQQLERIFDRLDAIKKCRQAQMAWVYQGTNGMWEIDSEGEAA